MTRFSQFFRKLFPTKPKVEKFTVEAPKPREMRKFFKEQQSIGSVRHVFFGTCRPMKPLPGQRSGWEKFQARERIRRGKEAAKRARETMKELTAV